MFLVILIINVNKQKSAKKLPWSKLIFKYARVNMETVDEILYKGLLEIEYIADKRENRYA